MVAILCYHKNISRIYPKKWIDEYRESILSQTYKKYQIFEMNYGGTDERVFENSYFESTELPSFVHALNILLDRVFGLGYGCAGNTNLDDYYSVDWIKTQFPYIKMGYDLVSSNFALIKNDRVIKIHKFHKLDILGELKNGHNPISHPSVFYSNKFWKTNRYIPEELPYEDMLLWERAIENGAKAIILEDCLLFHRIHENSVCQSQNR